MGRGNNNRLNAIPAQAQRVPRQRVRVPVPDVQTQFVMDILATLVQGLVEDEEDRNNMVSATAMGIKDRIEFHMEQLNHAPNLAQARIDGTLNRTKQDLVAKVHRLANHVAGTELFK